MPNINLVAVRRDEKRQITTLSRQLFMGLVASGLILVVTFLGMEGLKLEKRNELAALDKKMDLLKPKLAQIEQRRRDIAELKPRVDTLDNARLSTLRWRAFMSVLSDATLANVFFTEMSTAGNPATPTVSLKGVAPTNTIVGEVQQRLTKTNMFDDVAVPSTTNSSAPEDPVQKVNFSMNLYLRPVVLADTPETAPSPVASPASGIGPAPGTTPVPSAIPAVGAAKP